MPAHPVARRLFIVLAYAAVRCDVFRAAILARSDTHQHGSAMSSSAATAPPATAASVAATALTEVPGPAPTTPVPALVGTPASIVATPAPAPLASASPRKRRALLIGVKYSGSPALESSIRDIAAVRAMCTAEGYTEFCILRDGAITGDPEFSGAGTPPTRDNIIAGMCWLTAGVAPGDTLFLHFSGRIGGAWRGTPSLLPSDHETGSAISGDEIREILIKPLQSRGGVLRMVIDSHGSSCAAITASAGPEICLSYTGTPPTVRDAAAAAKAQPVATLAVVEAKTDQTVVAHRPTTGNDVPPARRLVSAAVEAEVGNWLRVASVVPPAPTTSATALGARVGTLASATARAEVLALFGADLVEKYAPAGAAHGAVRMPASDAAVSFPVQRMVRDLAERELNLWLRTDGVSAADGKTVAARGAAPPGELSVLIPKLAAATVGAELTAWFGEDGAPAAEVKMADSAPVSGDVFTEITAAGMATCTLANLKNRAAAAETGTPDVLIITDAIVGSDATIRGSADGSSSLTTLLVKRMRARVPPAPSVQLVVELATALSLEACAPRPITLISVAPVNGARIFHI
jgi:hypothetical protein